MNANIKVLAERPSGWWYRRNNGRSQMANKYGKNGEAVSAFLEDVQATDLDGWRTFLELEAPSKELTAAVRAVSDAPLSASARAAVYSDSRKTVRGLGLGDSGLGMGLKVISFRVNVAATGLAVRETLSPEHLRVLLAPFVALGFRSGQN
jgi:hypothetical protein